MLAIGWANDPRSIPRAPGARDCHSRRTQILPGAKPTTVFGFTATGTSVHRNQTQRRIIQNKPTESYYRNSGTHSAASEPPRLGRSTPTWLPKKGIARRLGRLQSASDFARIESIILRFFSKNLDCQEADHSESRPFAIDVDPLSRNSEAVHRGDTVLIPRNVFTA